MPGDVWASAGRWFDRGWYLIRNPDVAHAGIDPLAHYLRYGEVEGRRPSPWFDPAWYRSVYDVPPGQSALEHFLIRRATGDFLPSTALYLVPRSRPWSDDIAAGIDPFDHFLSDRQLPEQELLPDLPLLQSSGLIDTTYFDINPADQFEAALDPVLHYVRFGWRRGLRPSTAFDPDWYAATNERVARQRINPAAHYALEGEAANRRPVPWFDPAWYRTRYELPSDMLALAHYLRHRHDGTVSPNALFDVRWYVARHGTSIPERVDPFSHYLVAGALRDINPSPLFDARAWRHRHMAPLAGEGQSELPIASRNPLVHHLRSVHAAR